MKERLERNLQKKISQAAMGKTTNSWLLANELQV
jgi:hypothetical protein